MFFQKLLAKLIPSPVVFGYQNLVGSEEAREAIGVKVNQMSRYVMRNQVGYQISRFAVFSLDEVAYFASKPRQAGRPKNS